MIMTILGGLYCYFLYGPFLRESNRACKALKDKWERERK